MERSLIARPPSSQQPDFPARHAPAPRMETSTLGVHTDEQRNYLHSLRRIYSSDDILHYLDALKSLQVLVVGEAIIDEYHYCVPDAMSNKTPTISARFESSEVFGGGVWAVGNQIAGLCGQVTVLAGTGTQEPEPGASVPDAFDGFTVRVVARPDAPTVRKRRFVHRYLNQKLFELTFLNDRPIPKDTEQAMMAAIDELAPRADLVIAVDFGHGLFTPPVIQRLGEKSRFLAVNAQINSSNRGFNSIRKYRKVDFISVDENEIRLPFGDRYGSLEHVVHRLAKESGCSKINVTLGERGTLYFDGQEFLLAPALTHGVVDAIGAGDALLAVTALMVRSGAPSALIPFVGNCMAGLATQIVGHRRPVDPASLHSLVAAALAEAR